MKNFVMWLGILVFVLMGLFPPWLYTYNATIRSPVYGSFLTGSQKIAGYYFLFAPPDPAGESGHGISLDITRLFVQWVIVIALTGGLIYTIKDKPKEKEKEGTEK